MSHRHDSLLGSASAANAPEMGLHVGASGARGGPSGLRKCLLDPTVAVPGAAALVLPGTLMVPRTQARPRGGMVRRGPACHVGAHLADEHGRDFGPGAGDLVQPFTSVRKRAHPLLDLARERGHAGVERA